MPSWEEPISDDERDRVLDKIANQVVGRGLETPAILFLEMHKPLTFMASQGLVVTSPLLAPLIGFERVHTVSRLLEDRNNVERLIRRIEDLTMQRRTPVEGETP
ncbi:MAG: hypothetical protein NT029_22060 [Armatimonadetes bacterium]|nr:hypothetical protein [Armatimonadota bacterium]